MLLVGSQVPVRVEQMITPALKCQPLSFPKSCLQPLAAKGSILRSLPQADMLQECDLASCKCKLGVRFNLARNFVQGLEDVRPCQLYDLSRGFGSVHLNFLISRLRLRSTLQWLRAVDDKNMFQI